MEHVQGNIYIYIGNTYFVSLEPHAKDIDDLHFFTIGCGSILNTGSAKNIILDRGPSANNVCYQGKYITVVDKLMYKKEKTN